MKECAKCHQTLEETMFYVKSEEYTDIVCKKCRKKQANERYLRLKKDLQKNGHSKILHKKLPLLRKICRKCHIDKDIKDFPYDKVSDCYSNICTACKIQIRIAPLPNNILQKKRDLFAKGLKKCGECGEILPLSKFIKKVSNPQRVGEYSSMCGECRYKIVVHPYQKKYRIQKSMASLIAFINEDFFCDVCRQVKPPYEMAIVNKKMQLCKNCQSERHKRAKRQKNHSKKDTPYKQLICSMRNSLKDSLVGRKGHKTFVYLGCTGPELKMWLESQFTKGMSWDNRGIDGWHIDHYVPISYFDLSQEEDRFICWNYRNLRPLWGTENVEKGDSLPNDYLQHIEKIKKELHFPFDNPQTK